MLGAKKIPVIKDKQKKKVTLAGPILFRNFLQKEMLFF